MTATIDKLEIKITQQDLRIGVSSQIAITVTNRNDASGNWSFRLGLNKSLSGDNPDDIQFQPRATRQADLDENFWWLVGDEESGIPIQPTSSETIQIKNLKPKDMSQQPLTINCLNMTADDPDDNAKKNYSPDLFVLGKEESPIISLFECYANSTSQEQKYIFQKDDDIVFKSNGKAKSAVLIAYGERHDLNLTQTDDAFEATCKLKNVLKPGNTTFQLDATFQNKTVSKFCFIRVEASGWNRIDNISYGSPTLLINDADTALYGVFRSANNACLYRLYPDSGKFGRDDELLKNSEIPKGMERSPGAFWNSKIWLVGGSQIDPNVCSNKVWSYSPTDNKSLITEIADPKWKPRMGHTCFLFQDKLWIMGGIDANGNPLKEVWNTSDGKTWSLIGELSGANWKPTAFCFLAVAPETKNLNVYGGVDAPFGTPMNIFFTITETPTPNQYEWSESVKDKHGTELSVGKPYGCAFVSRNTETTGLPRALFGYFEDNKGLSNKYCDISGNEQISHQAPDEGTAWQTSSHTDYRTQAFRLSAVYFNRNIYVISILYDENPRSIVYYLSPKADTSKSVT